MTMDKDAKQAPISDESAEEVKAITAKEISLMGLLATTSEMQMAVFNDMARNPDAGEVTSSVVDFHEKKLRDAAAEFVDLYDKMHAVKEEIEHE